MTDTNSQKAQGAGEAVFKAADALLSAWRAKYRRERGGIHEKAPFREEYTALAVAINDIMTLSQPPEASEPKRGCVDWAWAEGKSAPHCRRGQSCGANVPDDCPAANAPEASEGEAVDRPRIPAAEFNALPGNVRRFIMMLETDCDGSGTIRSEMFLRDQVELLEKRLAEKQDVATSSVNIGNIVVGGIEYVPLEAYQEAMAGWKAANAKPEASALRALEPKPDWSDDERSQLAYETGFHHAVAAALTKEGGEG